MPSDLKQRKATRNEAIGEDFMEKILAIGLSLSEDGLDKRRRESKYRD
jgi:hypothetical protein